MSFIAERRTACTECDELIEPGQLATFVYSQYAQLIEPGKLATFTYSERAHATCPEPRDEALRPVCPSCNLELPASGVCGDCDG